MAGMTAGHRKSGGSNHHHAVPSREMFEISHGWSPTVVKLETPVDEQEAVPTGRPPQQSVHLQPAARKKPDVSINHIPAWNSGRRDMGNGVDGGLASE